MGETLVRRLVDLTHAAAADAPHDSVGAAEQRAWLYTRRHCRPDSNGLTAGFNDA
jgi:hypothetical protein